MTERGAEVEHLMSLDGTPLLVDMSANSASASASGGPKKPKAGNVSANDDAPGEGGGGHERPLPQQGETTQSGRRRGSANEAGGQTAETSPPSHESRGRRDSTATLLSRSRSTPNGAHGENPPEKGGETAAAAIASARGKLSSAPSSPLGLDAARVLATASTPQLPSFSQGSSPQLELRAVKSSRQDGQSRTAGDGVRSSTSKPVACDVAKFSGALAAQPVSCQGRATSWIGGNGSGLLRQQQCRDEASCSSRHSSGPHLRSGQQGGGTRAAEEGRRTAVIAAAARDRASMLLASHLTPFPTITKNRSLHAVAQPIVKHSEGFADACRGEISTSGTAAWRVAREARYDGLVAPADRLSIVRQIEAGFGSLQGRSCGRVSPVA